MDKLLKFLGLVTATVLLLFVLRWTHALEFNNRQILSISIFSLFIYGTLMYGEFRLAFAFGGIAALMACRLLTVERFITAASLDVIIFLIGTFLVIGFLEESQFFEHVVAAIVSVIGPRPQSLLLVLMFIGSIASALVGEVTAVLFMAGAMLHLTSKYKLNPVPFIIMLVFACNTGSAMSSVGNPIGVLIALKTGLTFVDFLKWAAPVALVVDAVTFLICRWWFADAFSGFAEAVKQDFAARAPVRQIPQPAHAMAMAGGAGDDAGSAAPVNGAGGAGPYDDIPAAAPNILGGAYYEDDPSHSLDNLDAKKTFRLCCVLLGALVVLLATHGLTEHLLGLKEGTMMVAAALIMGCVVLVLRREKARELVERRVDWWTLSFFMMLFASVGTLEDTQVTLVIAKKLGAMGGSQWTLIQVVGWATGWLSAFLDNVLAVATFMPVVHDIRMRSGVPFSSSIYWFMLFGGTFMGNMTIIGSTANIVAVGLLEKRGHGTIRFGYWMKIGVIVSIASMLVATGMLMVVDRVSPHGIPKLAPPVPEHVAPAE